MKSQIQQLIDYITIRGEVSYNEVGEKAMGINPYWRSETWTRGLRNAGIGKVKRKGVVVAYRVKSNDQIRRESAEFVDMVEAEVKERVKVGVNQNSLNI